MIIANSIASIRDLVDNFSVPGNKNESISQSY